jgi:[ribosomal protein S5]-alanine N-acetyltransferase
MAQVFLRLLEPSDVNETYLSWFRDDEVTSFLEVDGKSLTVDKVVDYIHAGRETGSYYMYAICLNGSGKHIGNLKVGPMEHKHGLCDLITVLGTRECWGKGIGEEAVKLGIELAFKVYGMRKLCAGIYSNNIGSIRAYTKAGFFIEAVLKDHYLHKGKLVDRIVISCFNPDHPVDQKPAQNSAAVADS